MAAALTLTACGGGAPAPESSHAVSAGPASADRPAANAAAPTTPAPVEALLAAQARAQADSSADMAAAALAADNAKHAANAADAAPEAVEPPPSPTMKALAAATPAAPALTVRARADIAGGVGAQMQVWVDGSMVGEVNVMSSSFVNYSFNGVTLRPGSRIELAFTNDGIVNGVDRNLYVAYVSDGTTALQLTPSNTVVDQGIGSAAFDGLDTQPWPGCICWYGAARLFWPNANADPQRQARLDAFRFLQQATFGASPNAVDGLLTSTPEQWITSQMALPYTPNFVNYINGKYALGDAYRPQGANYTPGWVAQRFWERAVNSSAQLRQRVGFALHQIFMVSLADSNLYYQARAYANYADLLHKHAFGNYRALLEDMALTPAMGIYLSHMRNRKEDPATGRMPDENFAREIMQLFSIGLYELNADGSLRRDGAGNPIETYTTADVLALAKVFTGWSWAYPDAQMNEQTFLWSSPSTSAADDPRLDLLPMKPYPAYHSTAEKRLFSGKPWAVTLAAGGSAQSDLKTALDTLFNHPNVGPFIGRQLIQHLVSSNPSPAYVGRVAAAFNNNGQGVRGDLGATVRAILLDPEARGTPAADGGKLREPVLRVSQWMRAMSAQSASGDYLLQWVLEDQAERAWAAPSVFGYFRPGYVPANTAFSARGATAPEFQIINESTVAAWINLAEALTVSGLGWNTATSANDVSATYTDLLPLARGADLGALPDRLDLQLLGGRMPASLRQQIIDITSDINPTSTDGAMARVRAAVFLTLASPEYLYQP